MAVSWVVTIIVSVLLFTADVSVADESTKPSEPFHIQINTTKDLNWWQTAVIYQLYPQSFKDSDGDGIGDINGIISKLDYLKDTGITAIYLSPIYKSPMVDNGYDISDFKSIDPVFGTMEDFDNLRNKTREKGLKLILDFVPNHSSDKHEWFLKSAMKEGNYTDYYIWADGRVNNTPYERYPPNNWLSSIGGPGWTWNEDRGQYYYHSYSARQPDLNYRSDHVVQEMEDVLKFWLDRKVDGFRVDAVHHLFEDKELKDEEKADNDLKQGNYHSLNHNLTVDQPENYEMVTKWRKVIDSYSRDGEEKFLFVEDGMGTLEQRMRYYGDTNKSGAHFPYNFDLIDKFKNGIKSDTLYSTILDWFTHGPQDHWNSWASGTHDNSRVASRLGADMVDAFNMLVLLLPGTAFTYQGEEIGMADTVVPWDEIKDQKVLTAGMNKSRDPERSPFQWDDKDNAGFSKTNKTWLPINSNYKSLNLKNQMKASNSYYNTYKRLAAARNNEAIQRGNLTLFDPNPEIFSFSREVYGTDNIFIVVLNVGNESRMVDLTKYSTTKRSLKIYACSVNSSFELNKEVNESIIVPARQAIVLTSTTNPEPSAASLNSVALPSLLITSVLIALLNSMFRS